MCPPAKTIVSAPPALANFWLRIYHSVPKICIPGTNLDVGFMFLSAAYLYGCRLVSEKALESQGWPASPNAKTIEAAASMAGVCHSTALVPLLGVLLLNQPYKPTARVDTGPQWYQDSVSAALQFCTGYMVYDTVMNLIVLRYVPGEGVKFQDSDLLYLGHHIATIFYMTCCRVLKAGHISAFACMFWGELTNPFFNSYLICQIAKDMDCCNGPLSQTLSSYIEIACGILFIAIRAFIGPVVLGIHATVDLIFAKTARENIPIALRLFFAAMIWGVLIGSIPWIYTFVDILKKHAGIEDSQEL